jgi:carbon-monoxide dehydrogenase large subunit
VKRDGTLVAREATLIWDKGAYADCGPAVSRNAGFGAAGPYQIPHVKVDSYSVYTNKVKAGSFRGFGVPQVTWASESQIDLIAKELGMDALEFRLKNAVEAGTVSATGEVLHSVGLKEALKKAAEAIGWGRPRPHSRGVGIAAMHKNTHTPTGSSAFVKVNEDGTVNLMAGTVDMGQGVATVLRQIAAEVLGMSPDRVSVTTPDTDFTPFENSTTSSRTTFHAGNAVKQAAEDALGQMLEVAAQVLEASPEDLQARGGRVFLRGAPEKGLSYPELFQRAKRLQRSILGTASYTTSDFSVPLDKETGQSPHPTAFWMYAAQAAEVEVDLATGAVRVLRLTAAHDLGKAINPMMAHAQLEGSLVMGLGSALLEEMHFENGQVVNPQFLDYKIPRIMDVPPMETLLVEAGHALGPYGAKGLGEPGLAPTAAAIGNAVYNAVGVRIYDLPITPEKVLRALKEMQESSEKGQEKGPKGRV